MKKYVFAMIAIVCALSLFAFTNQANHKKPVVDEKWFLFNGLPGEENDETKYSVITPQPSSAPCLQSAIYMCAIKIEPNGSNQPDFLNHTASVKRYKQTPQ